MNISENQFMRHTLVALFVVSLAGCSMSPPKPPAVQGEYRPVNRAITNQQTAKTKIFDYRFEGDIVDALPALREAHPSLIVLPPEGMASPVTVKINLHGTTLEKALRAIGEQGGGNADVVWNPANKDGGDQAFIRFSRTINNRGIQ
ncbi:hypothetical protein [Sulfuriferula sp.]|uniref:hypothetical protein n=1 Tax=Sulfuriferula sp. TaxID=2025307 RepID=UPI002730FEBD|nr:hypothetical protein [Sulfuriferula sp.]MDP2027522.1 hypothetical protein [Sulfuriferula sp.]